MSHRDKDSDYRAAFLSPLDYGEKFSDLVGAKGADPDAESDPSLSDESWAASPATRAEEPTRLPEMTIDHVRALNALVVNAPPATREWWMGHIEQLDALVRSLSTGSHGLYEKRSEVKVSREELEALRNDLGTLIEYNAFNRRYHGKRIRETLSRWLSSDTQHEVADR